MVCQCHRCCLAQCDRWPKESAQNRFRFVWVPSTVSGMLSQAAKDGVPRQLEMGDCQCDRCCFGRFANAKFHTCGGPRRRPASAKARQGRRIHLCTIGQLIHDPSLRNLCRSAEVGMQDADRAAGGTGASGKVPHEPVPNYGNWVWPTIDIKNRSNPKVGVLQTKFFKNGEAVPLIFRVASNPRSFKQPRYFHIFSCIFSIIKSSQNPKPAQPAVPRPFRVNCRRRGRPERARSAGRRARPRPEQSQEPRFRFSQGLAFQLFWKIKKLDGCGWLRHSYSGSGHVAPLSETSDAQFLFFILTFDFQTECIQHSSFSFQFFANSFLWTFFHLFPQFRILPPVGCPHFFPKASGSCPRATAEPRVWRPVRRPVRRPRVRRPRVRRVGAAQLGSMIQLDVANNWRIGNSELGSLSFETGFFGVEFFPMLLFQCVEWFQTLHRRWSKPGSEDRRKAAGT